MPRNGYDWDAIIAALRGEERLRVWSVIITVFGDAIVPRGDRISLQALQEILARLGIEPGAVRTALSRLASEGWVIREREGRRSFYSLDSGGRRAFDIATQRIYAPGPPQWDGRWTVIVPILGEDVAGPELQASGFASRNGTWIRPETVGALALPSGLENYLVIADQPGDSPQDAYRFWDLDSIGEAVRVFLDALRPLIAALEAGARPDPLEAIALRTLLIHGWRRIILKGYALPIALLPPNWPALEGRGRVKAVYEELVAPSEAWLTDAGLPPLSAPEEFAARFGGTSVET